MVIDGSDGMSWSDDHISRLHMLWTGGATKEELQTAFPSRTWGAIRTRAWVEGFRRPAWYLTMVRSQTRKAA